MSKKANLNQEKEKKFNYGARLKEARRESGMTANEVKELFQKKKIPTCSVVSISHWENNKVDRIRQDVFKVYSEISGYTLDYLMGNTDNPHETIQDIEEKERQDKIERRYNKKTKQYKLLIELINTFTNCKIEKVGTENDFWFANFNLQIDSQEVLMDNTIFMFMDDLLDNINKRVYYYGSYFCGCNEMARINKARQNYRKE